MNFVRKRRKPFARIARLRYIGMLAYLWVVLWLGWMNVSEAIKPVGLRHTDELWFVLEPESGVVSADDTVELHLLLEDATGRSKDLTSKTEFEKEGDSLGTLVDNIYTPASVGQTTMRAEIFGQLFEGRYEIVHGSAASLGIAPTSATIKIGETQIYELAALDHDQNSFDPTLIAQWSVSGGGGWVNNAFTAGEVGHYTIHARVDDVEATADIDVVPVEPDPNDAPQTPSDEPEDADSNEPPPLSPPADQTGSNVPPTPPLPPDESSPSTPPSATPPTTDVPPPLPPVTAAVQEESDASDDSLLLFAKKKTDQKIQKPIKKIVQKKTTHPVIKRAEQNKGVVLAVETQTAIPNEASGREQINFQPDPSSIGVRAGTDSVPTIPVLAANAPLADVPEILGETAEVPVPDSSRSTSLPWVAMLLIGIALSLGIGISLFPLKKFS